MRQKKTKASFWKGWRLAMATFIYFTVWGAGMVKRYRKAALYLIVCKMALDGIEELLDR
jgi:hypothetical protein